MPSDASDIRTVAQGRRTRPRYHGKQPQMPLCAAFAGASEQAPPCAAFADAGGGSSPCTAFAVASEVLPPPDTADFSVGRTSTDLSVAIRYQVGGASGSTDKYFPFLPVVEASPPLPLGLSQNEIDPRMRPASESLLEEDSDPFEHLKEGLDD